MKKFICLAMALTLLFSSSCASVSSLDSSPPLVRTLTHFPNYAFIAGATLQVSNRIQLSEDRVGTCYGSAVIVNRIGNQYYALTCWHVVRMEEAYPEAKSINYSVSNALLPIGAAYKIINYDAYHDIALIRFATDKNLPVAKLATKIPELGELVYTYGYGGADLMASDGYFMGESDRVSIKGGWKITDCTVWYGCSGGGAWNGSGEYIGTLATIMVANGPMVPQSVAGVGGVIPYTISQEFLEASFRNLK